MIAFVSLLLGLVVAGVLGTIREIRLDRPAAIPRSHFVDPDQLPPAERTLHR